MSDNVLFEEGEVFFAEVPNKRIDRKVKTMEGNNVISCRECLFRQKEFKKICPLM